MAHRQRDGGLHLDGDLVDDAEQAIARADDLHLIRIVALIDLLQPAVGRDQPDAGHIRADLAEAAGEGGVLGGGGRHGAQGDVADLGGDVRLQPALLQRIGQHDMGDAGLDRHRVVGEVQDAVHGLHVDHGAAASSPFMRAVECIEPAGAHRRGKAHLVDEDLDQVLDALGRDHDLGMVGPGAVPGLDGDVLLDFHALPPPPGRQTIKQTAGESRLQAAALSHRGSSRAGQGFDTDQRG